MAKPADNKPAPQQQPAPQQTAPSVRDNFMSAYGKRYADMDTSDDDAVYGQMGKDYEELDQLRSDRDNFNNLMNDEDGVNAEIMNGMLTGKNVDGSKFSLIRYLIGDHPDLAKAALEGDEESLDQLIEARNQEIKDAAAKKLQDEADDKELAEKIKAEDAELDQAIADAKYDQKQVRELIDWIYGQDGILVRCMSHDLKKDDFAKLIRIVDYEGAVAKADETGYKRGRSERIAMNRQMHSDENRPTNLGTGGGAGRGSGRRPDSTLSALDRMGRV